MASINQKGRKVLVTNGNEIRRLLWFERRPNGFYYGWCSEDGEIFHGTCHQDGSRFWTIVDKKQHIGNFQKLSEFKGFIQLANMSVSNIEKTPTVAPYKFKRLDSAVFLDMRTFGGRVNLDIFLLEPYRLDLLNPLLKSGRFTTSCIHLSEPLGYYSLSTSGLVQQEEGL